MTQKWMIYGANGYTGALIARTAVAQGMKPILAGRRKEEIHTLANELGLESRVFSLNEPDQVTSGLREIDLVLHCAGPFSATSAPMIEGCLEMGSHYLDITGEISVFEHAHELKQAKRAEDAGVVLCPGVGFDVIPT
ncbi:MAG: saccharopine dehydrogenase NADP-binding domain-containing protein, partial [Paenisporosarcina sp.]